MCDGGVFSIPIATFVIGTVTSLATASEQQRQQKEQASAAAAYQEAQAAEYARVQNLNNKAAVQEYVNQSAAERMAEQQEAVSASEQMQQAQREALEKQGTMLASTNAAGGALNFLMQDYERQDMLSRDAIRHQQEMNVVGHTTAIESYKEKAQNRINSQQNYIAAPINTGYSSNSAMLGTALGIGNAAIRAYGAYDKYSSKAPGNISAVGSWDRALNAPTKTIPRH